MVWACAECAIPVAVICKHTTNDEGTASISSVSSFVKRKSNDMKRQPLDTYIQPKEMLNYLANYGPHFSKKLCDFAVGKMKKKDGAGKAIPIDPWSKTQVDELLERNGVTLDNDNGYDAVYVANMCKAVCFKRSVPDEAHVALYVKDKIDDPFAPDGTPFRQWYATAVGQGLAVIWEDMV